MCKHFNCLKGEGNLKDWLRDLGFTLNKAKMFAARGQDKQLACSPTHAHFHSHIHTQGNKRNLKSSHSSLCLNSRRLSQGCNHFTTNLLLNNQRNPISPCHKSVYETSSTSLLKGNKKTTCSLSTVLSVPCTVQTKVIQWLFNSRYYLLHGTCQCLMSSECQEMWYIMVECLWHPVLPLVLQWRSKPLLSIVGHNWISKFNLLKQDRVLLKKHSRYTFSVIAQTIMLIYFT